MVDQLYVGRGTKKAGPFSPSQLRGLAASGRLQPTDTIWKEGMEKAVPAAKVKNLFSAPLAQPPPPDASFLPPGPDEDAGSASSPAPSDGPARPDGSSSAEVSLQIGALVPLDLPSPAGQASPAEMPPHPQPVPVRKRRAISLKGAVILNQDGVSVHYRKKCSKCGFEDACRSTLHINQGVTRVNFYCPKCRKSQDVQIQGVME